MSVKVTLLSNKMCHIIEIHFRISISILSFIYIEREKINGSKFSELALPADVY